VAAEQQRPDVQEQRQGWAEWQATLTEADLDRLVFWDETWAVTVMTLLYGRAPRGQRVIEYVPQGHWERLTVAAALRLGGVCGALVYEGGTTAEAAEAFVTAGLAGGLKPGDIVVMGNLSSHTHADVLRALARQGVQVKLLPPYSPDLNPLERAWSKVKQALRRAKARTTGALIDAVADALRSITPNDIRGWFEHCGYHNDS
jgi:transposase